METSGSKCFIVRVGQPSGPGNLPGCVEVMAFASLSEVIRNSKILRLWSGKHGMLEPWRQSLILALQQGDGARVVREVMYSSWKYSLMISFIAGVRGDFTPSLVFLGV